MAAAILVGMGYLVFVRKYCAPYPSNADASCYINEARQFLSGELKVPIRPLDGIDASKWDPQNQRPLGFRLVDRNTMILIGAPGYPLHLCLASWFVGVDWAAVPVNMFAAGAAGLLMLALCRQAGLGWAWCAVGVATLWACPVFVFQELQPMTDVLSMTWYLAAIVAAWYGRDRFVWAVAAGAAVGVAVLVRPANLLIVLPLSVVFGVRWRSWIGLVLGGIPAAAFQAWYNLALFGRLLATGYGDLSENFGARFVPWNIRYLSGELFATLGPVVLGAAVLALWLSRRRGTMMRLLIAWFVTVVGFHLFCEYSGFWGCVRYLLPAFPPIIVAALLGSREVVEKIRDAGWRRVVAVGLCVVSLGWELVMCQRRDVTIMKRGEIIYVQIADWMRRNAPANAWVVSRQASGALYYYTRFQIVRPDIMTRPNRDVFYAAAEKTKHPVYAVMFDPERKEAMGRMGGEWQELARYGAMTAWRLVRAPESRE